MFTSKNIVIVAPPQYFGLSRMIAHEISKIEGCKSTVWKIEHYVHNEGAMGSGQYAIFVGNPEENTLSKDYLEVMETTYPDNGAGIFYAFNSTKAIVYGNGDLSQVAEFKDLYRKIKNGELEVDEDSSNLEDAGSYFAAAVLLGLLGIGFMFLFKFYSKRKKQEKLRKEQTKLALALFLAGNFKKWMNIKEEEILEHV